MASTDTGLTYTSARGRWVILATVLGSGMAFLDSTVVNIALPRIGTDPGLGPSDRGAAIGAWSGLGGVAAAVGPFLGGWLVEAAAWRLVFLINLPLAAVVVWVTMQHVPESRDVDMAPGLDISGALLAALGLA